MTRLTSREHQTLFSVALPTLLVVVVCVMTYFASAVTVTAATTTQLKTYTDPGHFFTLQYPDNMT
jgi:hypothetical protein